MCEPGYACAGGGEAVACAAGTFSFEGFVACSADICDKGCANAVVATCDEEGVYGCRDYVGCQPGTYGENCELVFDATAAIVLGWITLLLSMPVFAVTVHRALFEKAQGLAYYAPRRLEAAVARRFVKDDADDEPGDDDGAADGGDVALSPMGGAPPAAEADDGDDAPPADGAAPTRLSYKARKIASSRRRANAALRTEGAKAVATGAATAAAAPAAEAIAGRLDGGGGGRAAAGAAAGTAASGGAAGLGALAAGGVGGTALALLARLPELGAIVVLKARAARRARTRHRISFVSPLLAPSGTRCR